MPTATVYSTPACAYCKMVKEFLDKHSIQYAQKDVAQDTEARDEMIQKSGQMGVPVTIINDKVIIGFDQARLKEALGIN